ncbi:hypothetical protein ACS0TK_16095, partial [Raoultella ornithinolytica]|uniref:hypothetical protein n=1 Tax=Raoultella ornithinolytica TaxID=54291 RepID=UPI003EC7799D
CSPVALRLPGLRVSAVFGVGCPEWCPGGCGTGTVYSPVALRLPGLRVRAVFGLVARSGALEAVALAPFVPRWRCACRGYG